jgi:uncharacterized cupin superfamily protein
MALCRVDWSVTRIWTWEHGGMVKVNVASCDLDEVFERGEFRGAYSTVTERLGGRVIGATVYEVQAGDKRGPYHYHHGVEEWMYVISGAPIHRDPSGERTLEPGDLVAFRSGPLGAHTTYGPGRVVIFSTGVAGWGEAFVTVYLDSDKIGAAPGVMFRRADALDSWREDTSDTSGPVDAAQVPVSGQASPMVNVVSMVAEPSLGVARGDGSRGTKLGPLLGGQTWAATLFELAPGEATAPYHYEWCREEWALVLGGTPTLRHPDGEDVLDPGDVVCFPEGPTGAHRLTNHSAETVRLIIFSTPSGRPMSAFYPDDGTVLVRIPGYEGFLFRLDDHIEDYWDGEPGAGAA